MNPRDVSAEVASARIVVPYTKSGCIIPGMNEKTHSERLEALYRKASDPVLRTHLLMVWRISLGDSVGEVAQMVGYSQKWTKEIARRYESEGVVRGLVIADTPIPAPKRGLCSTRGARHGFGRLF